MSIEATRTVIEDYLHAHGLDLVADDAVFTVMGSGFEAKGKEAIGHLIHYFYEQAFEARADTSNLVIGEGRATLEADFTGRHIGEFAGIAATGKEVHVPLCIVYGLEDQKIIQAHIYFEMDALRRQLDAV